METTKLIDGICLANIVLHLTLASIKSDRFVRHLSAKPNSTSKGWEECAMT